VNGVSPPADCWDTNATVWPGGIEIPGNGIDDDCAGGDQPARLSATVKHKWTVVGGRVRVTQLRVRDAPAAAKVAVRCRGRRCPFRVRKAAVKANGTVALRRFLRRRLRHGVTVEVRVIAPNSIGKVVRFRIRRGKIPVSRTLRLPPGARRARRCCQPLVSLLCLTTSRSRSPATRGSPSP
jgi:Putative metal-binding motif